MILYSIRRKDTGQKFAKWEGSYKSPYQEPKWADKPQFYRDISSVLHTVSWLSTKEKWENVYREKNKRFPWASPTRNCCGYKAYKPKVLKSWLKRYEILKHDITINGTETISAEKFFKQKVQND